MCERDRPREKEQEHTQCRRITAELVLTQAQRHAAVGSALVLAASDLRTLMLAMAHGQRQASPWHLGCSSDALYRFGCVPPELFFFGFTWMHRVNPWVHPKKTKKKTFLDLDAKVVE